MNRIHRSGNFLGAVFILLIILMIVIFSYRNIHSINQHNEMYLKDNAILKAEQLDMSLNSSLEDMVTIAHLFGKNMQSDKVTAADLKELEAFSGYDYVRYVDASGINIASDGSSNNAKDRDYYIEGMKGRSGISVTQRSRITGETLVNFYTPLEYRGEIIGVLRGVYLAEERMKSVLKSSCFGYNAVTIVCRRDGTIIAGSRGFDEDTSTGEKISSFIKSENYRDEFLSQDIMESVGRNEDVSFEYDTAGGTEFGYITTLEDTGWRMIQTFPAEAASAMYASSLRSTGLFIGTIILIFIIYIVFMYRDYRRDTEKLLEENRDMEYIIWGAKKLFVKFIVVDLQKGTYRYLLNGESSFENTAKEGDYSDLLEALGRDALFEDERKDLVHELSLENLHEAFSGDVREFQIDYRAKHLEGSWMRINAVCIEGEEGNCRVLLETRNVTDLKKVELERQNVIRHALEEADRANSAKSTFLFNMSHDIRTPMNAIIGFADIAAECADDSEAVSKCIGKIRKSGDVLLRIINDVLDLARIESGKMTISMEPHNICEELENVHDMFRDSMAEAGISFGIRTRVQDEGAVYDDKRMVQILINLLSNAQKFTPEGGRVNLECIQTGSENGSASYMISVKDTGIGIDENFLPYLFEAFERERNSTVTGIQGTGLGLSIVKNLVDMMGGTIRVESEAGKGSEFIVEFTFETADAAKSMSSLTRNSDEKVLNGRRFLVVEDNELNVEIACSILTRARALAETAFNGVQALEKLYDKPEGYYDAVILDIFMPEMNGYETARRIRASERSDIASIPVVAMTANAFEEDRKKAMESGMNDFVSKPVDAEKLVNALAGII